MEASEESSEEAESLPEVRRYVSSSTPESDYISEAISADDLPKAKFLVEVSTEKANTVEKSCEPAPCVDASPVLEGEACAVLPTIISYAESDWSLVTPATPAEVAVEQALLLCLKPAIYGVPLLRIPSAATRAADLLEISSHDVEAAVALAAGEELAPSRMRLLVEFILKQIPFLGLPVGFLASALGSLRAVAVIAALYGHDLEIPRIQHEILFCLFPGGETVKGDHSDAGGAVGEGLGAVGLPGGSLEGVARGVAKAFVSGVLGRVTGVTLVGELVSLGGSLLWEDTKGIDSFEVVAITPATTARQYFAPSSASPWLRTQALFLSIGMISPILYSLPLRIFAGLIEGILIVGIIVGLISRVKNMGEERKERNLEKANALRRFLHFVADNISWVASLQILANFILFLHAILPFWGFLGSFRNIIKGLFKQGNVSTAQSLALIVLGALSLITVIGRKYENGDRIVLRLRISVLCVFVPLLWFDELGGEKMIIPWWTVGYMLSSVASICQFRFLELLKRREVFLRLLGAERLAVLSLSVLFRQITPRIGEDLANFLRAVSPAPEIVCLLHAARMHAFELATLIAVLPAVVGPLLPGQSGFIVGVSVGVGVVGLIVRQWHMNVSLYESPFRVLLLLPGELDTKVKDLLSSTGAKLGRFVALAALRGIIIRFFSRFVPKIGIA